MPTSRPIPVTLQLDQCSIEILDRLRGEMTPSDFLKLLLQMVDSGRVSAPSEYAKAAMLPKKSKASGPSDRKKPGK